jgi:hypothetical protein
VHRAVRGSPCGRAGGNARRNEKHGVAQAEAEEFFFSQPLPNLKPSTRTISLRLPQHLLDASQTLKREWFCKVMICMSFPEPYKIVPAGRTR